MTKTLIIMRGLPGSGKSTKVKELGEGEDVWSVYSTDHYWMRPDGFYDFNFRRLGEAHGWNQSCVKNCMSDGEDDCIIVDNTNTTWKEIKPYVLLAKQYGYDVEIEEPDTDWKFNAAMCFNKNTHGVPVESIQKMLGRWEDTKSIEQKVRDLLNA